jgi:hypothetical protein
LVLSLLLRDLFLRLYLLVILILRWRNTALILLGSLNWHPREIGILVFFNTGNMALLAWHRNYMRHTIEQQLQQYEEQLEIPL